MATSMFRKGVGSIGRLLLRIQHSKLEPSIKGNGKFFSISIVPYSRSGLRLLSTEVKAADAEKPVIHPELDVPKDAQLFKEKFIPITRRSVVRLIMQEEGLLSQEERQNFEKFASGLDSAIVNKYHGILQELKTLFDPLNPDKDTIATREWNRRDRLDNEFWLLQRLEDVMEKANFHELPKSVVAEALAERQVKKGIRVKVNADKYDVLRFWALGKELPKAPQAWYIKALQTITRRSFNKPSEYYKRVVIAIRLKKDHKLTLKSFKEIPASSLEMLLPDGKLKMTAFDKGVIGAAVGVASLTIFGKIISLFVHTSLDWILLVTGATVLVGVQGWTVYLNRRNSYMADLNKIVYFKNISNNRGLLTMLIDRAEDEVFKEALLTYAFLLSRRAPSVALLDSNSQLPAELGGISDSLLEKNIEDWVASKSSCNIEFDSSESVALLKHFGILSDINDKLHVLPLKAAISNLPEQPQTLVARGQDADIMEGYDRDYFMETDEEYKKEEQKSKKFGWF